MTSRSVSEVLAAAEATPPTTVAEVLRGAAELCLGSDGFTARLAISSMTKYWKLAAEATHALRRFVGVHFLPDWQEETTLIETAAILRKLADSLS